MTRGDDPADVALDATLASGSGPGASASSAPPRAPDRYRVIRQLGAGAMGVVWEAEDTVLHRRVALKWVTPKASGDREYRARLFREARALAQLHHPNVVAVHDVGEVGDELYLALELIVGTTARAWLAAKPRTPAEGLAVWRQAALGLAAVHKAGMSHRDIKPENVFVADDGRVVVGDFGLATGDLGQTVLALTVSGAVIGTPMYMACEQLAGEPASAKSDQFALCVCLWEAIAGKRPYDSTTMAGLALAMLKPLALPPGGDKRIFTALRRGLSADPEARWPDVASLIAALEPRASGKSRGGLIAVAVAAALAVGAGGVIGWQQLMKPSPPVAAAPSPVATPLGAAPPPPPLAAAPSPVPVGAAPPPLAAPPLAAPPVAAAPAPLAAAPTPLPAASAPLAAAPNPPPSVAPTAAPLPAPAATPDWRVHYDAATAALDAGDATRCSSELAAAGPLGPDVAEAGQKTRVSCLMLSGDCLGGHEAVATWSDDHHWTHDRFLRAVADLDARWCPLDAQPKASWPARAGKRLQQVAYDRKSCTEVLDFIASHHVVLPAD